MHSLLFGDPLLEGLNDAQRDAVETIEGPIQVIASAGSGKTTVLTRRIAYLVRSGIQPEHVLAVTFTQKAAQEMAARLKGLLEKKSLVERLTVGTFHSFCLGVLEGHYEKLGFSASKPTLITDIRQKTVMQSCLGDLPIAADTALGWVGRLKNQGLTPEAASRYKLSDTSDEAMGAILESYRNYRDYCREHNLIDFDDQLLLALQLLERFPDVARTVQERYRHVLVDEFQDVNPVQYKIARQVAHPHNNLFVVGDDAQTIYQFRGSDIKSILGFTEDYPEARRIMLDINYRSVPAVIEASNRLIRHNLRQIHKEVQASRAPLEGEQSLILWDAEDTFDEAHRVMMEIKGLLLAGFPAKEIAVLYRGHSQSAPLEEELSVGNIPYTVKKQSRFFELPEILDALAYLQLIRGDEAEVGPALDRLARNEGINLSTLELIRKEAKRRGEGLLDACCQVDFLPLHPGQRGAMARFIERVYRWQKRARQETVAPLLHHVLQESGMIRRLEEQGTDSAHQALSTLNSLYEMALKWGSPTIARFFKDIEAHQMKKQKKRGPADAVQLMTIHAAKGLEFDAVFVIGMEEELLPYKKCLDVEEERRLCYVAITRPRKKLYLSRAVTRHRFGKPYQSVVSRFWHELTGEAQLPLEPAQA